MCVFFFFLLSLVIIVRLFSMFLLQFGSAGGGTISSGLVFMFPKLVLANLSTCMIYMFHSIFLQSQSGSMATTQTEYIDLLVCCFLAMKGEGPMSLVASITRHEHLVRPHVSYCFFKIRLIRETARDTGGVQIGTYIMFVLVCM